MPTLTQDVLAAPAYFRGRVGLCSVLRALHCEAGSEVIIQAFTCVAVVEGVLASGATPRYADIEPTGFNIDPDTLEARITARTKAIVVQHTFGIPAQMNRIMRIADKHGVPVIEDCCHSFHSAVDGRVIGEFGVASFYSFEWGKPVIIGLGGVALARDPALRAALSRQYEQDFRNPPAFAQLRLELQYWAFQLLYRPSLYWFVRSAFRRLSAAGVAAGSFHDLADLPSIEFGWRMAPILRRRLKSKLSSLETHAQNARSVVRGYRQRIQHPGVTHPDIDPEGHILVRYPLRVASKTAALERARAERVEMAGWYETPVHPIPLAQLGEVGLDPAECPHAVRRCAEIVSLPINARVTAQSMDRVAAVLATL